MNEILPIMSAAQYFDKYGREGIYKNHADRKLVRSQLIDAFHKEIFGLVAIRAKKRFEDIPMEGDPEAMRIARNVIKDETKKWRKLVDMFETYRETSGVIRYDDITIDPGEGEMGIMDGEIVMREKLEDGTQEIEEEEDVETATSGYVAILEEEAEDVETATSGYVAILEEEAEDPQGTDEGSAEIHGAVSNQEVASWAEDGHLI